MKIHFINDIPRATWKPKLGIGYLSSYLKKYFPGIKVSISFPEDDIVSDIKRIKPDVLLLTSTSNSHKKITELSGFLRKNFPETPQIIGGPHVSLIPEDLPVSADIGVSCEGEETLFEILKSYEKHGKMPVNGLEGTIYRRDGGNEITVAPPRKPIEPLDKIPPPDLDLLQVASRKPEWGSLHIMTSRGCPYRCRFCASSRLWPKARFFTPQYVFEEIKSLVEKYGQRMIVIYDDLFILHKKRTLNLSELIQKAGLHKKVEFECAGRVDVFDAETAAALKKMNVTQISFGMESGSEKMLNYLKNDTIGLDEIRRAVQIAKKAGIEVGGTFMIGSPGETEEDILKTIAFIQEIDLDFVSTCVTTPYPKTQLWEDAREMGLLKQDQWAENLFVINGITPENMNQKTLVTEIKKERLMELQQKLFGIAANLENRRQWRRFIRNPDIRWMAAFLKNNWRSPVKMAHKIISKARSGLK